ncbi:MAG: copper chaperone PCu(A)C [Pseudomonas sp.]
MRTRLLAAALLALVCSASFAHEYPAGELHIAHPWSRALPPNAPVGAAYFVVHNNGKREDRLLGAQTPRAEKAELHTHVQLGEVMKMQKIDSLGIPPGGTVTFAPGGNHLMLFGLKQPLVAGERFALTLEFEKAGKVEVEVAVEAEAPAEQHQH